MRFDDRLSTVLDGNYDSPRARALRWQQLTDIVAQAGPTLAEPVATRALHMIALLSRDVPPQMLQMQAAAVAARSSYAPLLVLLAGQSPAAAEAVIPAAMLSEEDWLSALPQLNPLSRALLRQRKDVSPRVSQALQLFAAGDMTLGHSAAGQSADARNATDIRDLVRRIEEYRQRQQDHRPVPAQIAIVGAVDRIAFVTDATARIIDAETRGRGRFVGIDLAQPAAAFETGCDAGTSRIIGKRGHVEAGRLLIQGEDRWAGTWLCDAEPRFATEDGAFCGYMGLLRRPQPHEVVAPQVTAPAERADSGFRPELLRQLMHELRSPLNAIGGFAQLIEGQYAGPVAAAYVAAARTILTETGKLGGVIDEIDLLAQMSDDSAIALDGQIGLQTVLQSVADDLRDGRQPFDLTFVIHDADDSLPAALAPPDLARILHLWLQPLARALTVQVTQQGSSIELRLDPGQGETTDAQQSLGFAFAAAAELARQCGGSLVAAPGQHILNIPLLLPEPASGERVG